MKKKVLLFGVVLAILVLGSAGSAFAQILVSVPPNPVAPPGPDLVLLVNRPAPVNVSIFFMLNPGPPDVTIPEPGPPESR